jgi:SAM-dependent methyltransferase
VTDKPHLRIVSHYESCLEKHGDSHLGVDWPDAQDADTRQRVMLELINPLPPPTPVRLLDFGCGASHLYEYLGSEGIENVEYTGLDLSTRFVELSRAKFPGNEYYCGDVLDGDLDLPRFDYVVMNGVFTVKVDLSFAEMLAFFQRLVPRVFQLADVGLAFNVLSKHVAWERDDLFHLPFDTLAGFLTDEVSRNFVFRNDYGLFEYTAYVYR